LDWKFKVERPASHLNRQLKCFFLKESLSLLMRASEGINHIRSGARTALRGDCGAWFNSHARRKGGEAFCHRSPFATFSVPYGKMMAERGRFSASIRKTFILQGFFELWLLYQTFVPSSGPARRWSH
jgi:hypothetical protein